MTEEIIIINDIDTGNKSDYYFDFVIAGKQAWSNKDQLAKVEVTLRSEMQICVFHFLIVNSLQETLGGRAEFGIDSANGNIPYARICGVDQIIGKMKGSIGSFDPTSEHSVTVKIHAPPLDNGGNYQLGITKIDLGG